MDSTSSDIANQQSICQSCGICCDGTLYSNVDIDDTGPDPAWPKAVAQSVREGKALPHPCSAFQKQQCIIYPTRPKKCRDYHCKLLNRYVNGGISYEMALTHIRDARNYQAALKRAVAEKFPQMADIPSKHLLDKLKQMFKDEVATDGFWKTYSKILLTHARLDHHLKSIFHNPD